MKTTSTQFLASMTIIGLASALFSCEEAVEPSRTFTIAKGDHYCTPRVTESQQSDVLEFHAMFDNSASYDLSDHELQSSKNKLMGFSDSNSLHHENSARFAWQWYNNRLEIFAYTYVDGERHEAFIGVAEVNKYSHFRLTLKETYYLFELNNEPPVRMDRGNVVSKGLYYKLWPYFGGSLPAPHEIRIRIKNVY